MALVDNAWYVNYGDGSTTGYFAVGAWVLTTTKVCGNLIRATAPTVGNERVFVCIASTAGTGSTGASEPTWVNTRGAKNTDGTVTWQEATGIAALNGDLSTNTPTWTTVKNTAVTLGQVIQNVAGTLILICTTAGTAGNGAEPTWAAFTNAGATTADNTVTWTTLGASFPAWGAPQARLANAFTTNWGQAGNKFFVGDNHAETQTTQITLTSPGTAASPIFVYCVDRTAAVPPGTGNLMTTATITCSLNNSIVRILGYAYYYGIIFQETGNASCSIDTLGQVGALIFDTCKFVIGVAATSPFLTLGNNGNVATRVTINNCTIKFGATGGRIVMGTGELIIKNCPSFIDATGSTPTTLFGFTANSSGIVLLDGVDLNQLGSGTIFGLSAQTTMVKYFIRNCKLGASATIASTPPGQSMGKCDLISCDSGATNYRNERYWYEGTQTAETTIVRTGGATDGTTPISWKLVTTANSKWVYPFESVPSVIWNDSTSAITTLTVYGTTTGGGVPNNDDIWVEVEYLGSASTPQGSFITSTKANNLAASVTTNNSSDGSTWGGGGAGNGFKIVVPSFTPGMKGPINITIKVAKPSSTYYIDPRPSISGITVSKSEILAPGVYANELSSGGGSAGMLFIPNMAGT